MWMRAKWKLRRQFGTSEPSSVHCPLNLHTGPGPMVYTALSFNALPAEI